MALKQNNIARFATLFLLLVWAAALYSAATEQDRYEGELLHGAAPNAQSIEQARARNDYREAATSANKEYTTKGNSGSALWSQSWFRTTVITLTIFMLLALGYLMFTTRNRRSAERAGPLRHDASTAAHEQPLSPQQLQESVPELEEKGAYSEAIRCHYQLLLLTLQDASWIQLSRHKTARQILQECAQSPFAAQLASLSLIHEHCRYGGRQPQEAEYRHYAGLFHACLAQIKPYKR